MKSWISWSLATIGAIVAIATSWSVVGWMSPEAHEEDLHKHQDATLSAIQGLSTKMDVNRDEWRCDELSEEIDELVKLTDRSPLESEILNRKRQAYEKNDCERFE